MLLIYELCRRTMLSSNMLTTLRYLLANTEQLTSPRNMIISVLCPSATSLPSILAKPKKIVFHRPAFRHLNISPPLPDIERALTKSSIAQTANCFPRLLNIDIVYIISSLPRLPHTALTVFGKDSITINQLPHVEYSQYKNSFITRCLFNFR